MQRSRLRPEADFAIKAESCPPNPDSAISELLLAVDIAFQAFRLEHDDLAGTVALPNQWII